MAQGVWGAQPLWSWEEPPALCGPCTEAAAGSSWEGMPVGPGWGRRGGGSFVWLVSFPATGRDSRRVLYGLWNCTTETVPDLTVHSGVFHGDCIFSAEKDIM